eukprot:5115243-Pyramimonas_sp.AAC.1
MATPAPGRTPAEGRAGSAIDCQPRPAIHDCKDSSSLSRSAVSCAISTIACERRKRFLSVFLPPLASKVSAARVLAGLHLSAAFQPHVVAYLRPSEHYPHFCRLTCNSAILD